MEEGKVPDSVKSFMVFSGAVFAIILWQMMPNDDERSGLEHFFVCIILGGGLWYYLALPYLRLKYGARFCGWFVWLPTFGICLSFSGELLIRKLQWLEPGVGGVIVISLISFIATRVYSQWMCGGMLEEDE